MQGDFFDPSCRPHSRVLMPLPNFSSDTHIWVASLKGLVHISIPHNRTPCGEVIGLGLTDSRGSHLFGFALASLVVEVSPLTVYIVPRRFAVVNTFLKNFWLFPLPIVGGEVATLGRYLVRLAVLGYLTTAFCSLGSLLSRPFFVLTLGDGVAYHLKQYLSVNCKPFSFTL